jgi:cobalt-zinc-cadmium efflux system outer membrane protein
MESGMRILAVVLVSLWCCATQLDAQNDTLLLPPPLIASVDELIAEALHNNPEIQAALRQMDAADARVPQAFALDDPMFQYTRQEMPAHPNSLDVFSMYELSQTIRFPSKLFAQRSIARIQAEHAHHDHLEVVNDVISRLKSAYYSLWLAQQLTVLTNENIRLMKQFQQIAQTKYRVGSVPQQDVLKAQVEAAMLENERVVHRQQERSAKAVLIGILNRAPNDTIGYAVIPEEVQSPMPLDSLIQYALAHRPMLRHDSLIIGEQVAMLSLMRQELLPDLRFGIEYTTSELAAPTGWTVRAGITLPFAPWSLGKARGRIQEANALLSRSQLQYTNSRNMIIAEIRDLHANAEGRKQQLDTFGMLILPQARQSLNASLTAYQNGQTDILMLIDAYRSLVSLTKEYFTIRMEYEQTLSQLGRAVGIHAAHDEEE